MLCSRWRLRSSSGGRGRGGEAGVSAGGSAEQRSAAGAGAARRRAHRALARAARATGTRLRMSPATRRAFFVSATAREPGVRSLTDARELSQPDRRRSLKCRYLHLQAAGRSQVLSGSGGTSVDSRRKFASDRAASHAPSAAMTSAPLYFFLRFHSKTTQCCIVLNATYHGSSRSTLLAAICSWKRASFFFCPIQYLHKERSSSATRLHNGEVNAGLERRQPCGSRSGRLDADLGLTRATPSATEPEALARPAGGQVVSLSERARNSIP